MTRTRTNLSRLVVAVVLVATACSGESEVDDAAAEEGRGSEVAASLIAEDADFSEVDATIANFVQAEGLTGAGLVIVDRDEGIVHEFYDGVIDQDRISLIASSSKMLTAGVLMRLDDERVLEVDAPISNVFGAGAAHPEITAAQLISNSSGLVGLLPDPTFAPYICQYIADGSLQDCAATILTTADDDMDVVPPDTEFRYGGAQWQVAGAVAEAASGRSWATLIEDTYAEPCGLDHLAYNNHFAQMTSDEGPFFHPEAFDGDPSSLRRTDNPNMEGGAYVTPPEYAELLLMQLRGGECANGRVLSESAVERMQTERVVATYGAELEESGLAAEDGKPLVGYAMGWWVGEDESYLEDAGAFGAVPWLDLGRGYGAYLVIEATTSIGRDLAARIQPLIETEIDRVRSS